MNERQTGNANEEKTNDPQFPATDPRANRSRLPLYRVFRALAPLLFTFTVQAFDSTSTSRARLSSARLPELDFQVPDFQGLDFWSRHQRLCSYS
ncbi:hypothetical protein BN1708_008073 [Verticillium longisporum]|uniref:Uncharacterized protein n=1 Tax=Verticillium longisporum TaxID=100787 RepID=A0A0G4N0V1_VERLO|nr:hypothetical protein BN1708_008073 [Verticillium longisporum]